MMSTGPGKWFGIWKFPLAVLAILVHGSALSAKSGELPLSGKWAFVLQLDRLNPDPESAVRQLAESDRDVIVMDFSFDGSWEKKWTPRQLSHIRNGRKSAGTSSTPKKLLAYLSIGEAEDYRHYWQDKWDLEKDGSASPLAPRFLLSENPDWTGNYKVRFWHQTWQDIILAYLNTIQDQGFDGVYLDIVDAFEFFEMDPETHEFHDHRINPETQNTYRSDMIQWVKKIASTARRKSPGFLIVPQNGVQLLEDKSYRDTISAIGVEDLFTDGESFQSAESRAYKAGFLDKASAAGIPILVIDYSGNTLHHRKAIKLARQLPASLLLTDRPLATLGRAWGSEPPPGKRKR